MLDYGMVCIVFRRSVPALQRIHKLSRCLQTSSHQHALLAHYPQGILQQPGLVFYRRRW